MKYDVGAYIWPAYSGDDKRSRIFWPEGIGEWQSLKSSLSKCDRHIWPRHPLWGYVNEGDPCVMEMQIEVAVSHGINVFAYDWYWYDNRPFLENCLNDGFLKARNNGCMRFYIMWANHPARYNWIKPLANLGYDNPVWNAQVKGEDFVNMTERLIHRYFLLDNYYKINGCPLFSIYEINNLIASFGSVEKTREALDDFRYRCVRAGLNGLHLQIICGNETQEKCDASTEFLNALGADSISSYGSGPFTGINIEYSEGIARYRSYLESMDDFPVPYFPSISLGWDNNPRYPDDCLQKNMITGRTAEKVKQQLENAKAYIERHPEQPPLMVINAWNEWTEDNYLEPDELYGYSMLDAVKEVFMEDNDK